MRGLLLILFFGFSLNVFGQRPNEINDKEAAYTHTITLRAQKIVQTLGIGDSARANHLTGIIAHQYRNLNSIYTDRDQQLKSIKEGALSKEGKDSAAKQLQDAVDKKIASLHAAFLSMLSSGLTPEQVIMVKDGMTYNVLKVTYDAYVDMIPSLTREQKNQIMDWLIEAREYAMDGESSEKKHWWFNKYKGRINNYLSAQGYDINKEREEWQKRRSTTDAKTNQPSH